MQNRLNALEQWLQNTLQCKELDLRPLTGDASFRRYYRLHRTDMSYIVMDAPPDKEPLGPFIEIGNLLRQHQLRTPTVHAVNEEQGFALLDDFGDTLLLEKFRTTHASPQDAESLYIAAMSALTLIQNNPSAYSYALPHFDKAFIRTELTVFKSWYLEAFLKLKLTSAETKLIDETTEYLAAALTQQPQVMIHRDYHSRNIMLLDDQENLGIIDYQDAMIGPCTYDLVSLLKDCYIQWPISEVDRWVGLFYQASVHAQQYTLAEFKHAFDLCGLQRHLKVLGVFCRLYLRDNKPNYIYDLPLTRHYVMACLESYPALHPFYDFMNERGQLPQ